MAAAKKAKVKPKMWGMLQSLTKRCNHHAPERPKTQAYVAKLAATKPRANMHNGTARVCASMGCRTACMPGWLRHIATTRQAAKEEAAEKPSGEMHPGDPGEEDRRAIWPAVSRHETARRAVVCAAQTVRRAREGSSQKHDTRREVRRGSPRRRTDVSVVLASG